MKYSKISFNFLVSLKCMNSGHIADALEGVL